MSGSSFSCSFKGAQLDSEKNIEATVMQCVKNLKPIVDRIGARNRELMNLCSRKGRRKRRPKSKKTNWHTNEDKQVQRKTAMKRYKIKEFVKRKLRTSSRPKMLSWQISIQNAWNCLWSAFTNNAFISGHKTFFLTCCVELSYKISSKRSNNRKSNSERHGKEICDLSKWPKSLKII